MNKEITEVNLYNVKEVFNIVKMNEKEETIKKAIKKVEKNGYNFKNISVRIPLDLCELTNGNTNQSWEQIDLNTIIFSHDFLKAFFGEHIICRMCGEKMKDSHLWGNGGCKLPEFDDDYYNISAWQHHGCKMLLEKEPLKYLEKFL